MPPLSVSSLLCACSLAPFSLFLRSLSLSPEHSPILGAHSDCQGPTPSSREARRSTSTLRAGRWPLEAALPKPLRFYRRTRTLFDSINLLSLDSTASTPSAWEVVFSILALLSCACTHHYHELFSDAFESDASVHMQVRHAHAH